MREIPQIHQIAVATTRMCEALSSVETESLPIAKTAGRVLAEPLLADRDSPAIDVSAMDGYAVRLADVSSHPMKVPGSITAGSPPIEMPSGMAVRIFTGAPIPVGAETVVRREDCDERGEEVVIRMRPPELRFGMNIRRRGENGKSGQQLLDTGTLLSTPAMSGVATFGASHIKVYRPVRVAILNTGEELVPPGEPVAPWQIRDSNGLVLESLLRSRSWIEVVERKSIGDSLPLIASAINEQLGQADAILLTGGVSMGDHDYVPEAILKTGGKIIFHRLPIRPGKPILGAVSTKGQLICGLPGNPVSVAVTARRFAIEFLAKMTNFTSVSQGSHGVRVANFDEQTLDLLWYRLAKRRVDSEVDLLESRGSGDLVSLSYSDGFIEVPARHSGVGPWAFYAW